MSKYDDLGDRIKAIGYIVECVRFYDNQVCKTENLSMAGIKIDNEVDMIIVGLLNDCSKRVEQLYKEAVKLNGGVEL